MGTTAPNKHLHIVGAGDQQIGIQSSDAGGRLWSLQSSSGASNGRFEIVDRTSNVSRLVIENTGEVGVGTLSPADKLHVNGIIRVVTLGVADTTTTLCRNTSNQIATCNSSSLRYKTDVKPFAGGLDMVKLLRPITFTWKQGGSRDLGFGAEDVAKIEPLLTFNNERGEVDGVKYDRLGALLVNAIKQQQDQLERRESQARLQEQTIRHQQNQIDALKKIVCMDHPNADICKMSEGPW